MTAAPRAVVRIARHADGKHLVRELACGHSQRVPLKQISPDTDLRRLMDRPVLCPECAGAPPPKEAA